MTEVFANEPENDQIICSRIERAITMPMELCGCRYRTANDSERVEDSL